MKIKMFCHSIVSDWNHGNAHFLRGLATELVKRGHEVNIYENENSWSRMNLINDYASDYSDDFRKYYPLIKPEFYNDQSFDLKKLLSDADAVIVHEWNTHSLVASIGMLKDEFGYKLYFHDTHHRAVTDPGSMKNYDLGNYDGVLAFGNIIRDIYISNGWTKSSWTFHEAADVNVFYPRSLKEVKGDIVWVGNWGDEERTEEIRKFLIEPVKQLKLKCDVYGVRYPDYALRELKSAGIEYKGWLPNYKVPEVFSQYRLTVHIPRGPYTKNLPGIPTIRPFEAMASGIPLISAPWSDSENLFEPGKDFLFVNDTSEMKEMMSEIIHNQKIADELTSHALRTIKSRHTCGHRADQFYNIFKETDVKELSGIKR